MKHLILLALLASSCSSLETQDSMKPFDKTTDCSPEALQYLDKHNPTKKGTPPSTEYVRSKLLKMTDFVRSCYETELRHSNNPKTIMICYVTGFDKKGNQEFVNFHSSEKGLTKEFYACLYEGNKGMDFKDLKDLTVIQPINLFPKN